MSRQAAEQWTTNARRDSLPAGTPFRTSFTSLTIQQAEALRGWLWDGPCPVPWEQLRIVSVLYKGFDGRAHTGRLLTHSSSVQTMVATFNRLYNDGFRIEQMDYMITLAVVQYPDLPTNNTYSFHCRNTTSGGSWSQHAYGKAVDVNPVQNPYYVSSSGYVFPPGGAAYTTRSPLRTGMIGANGLVETAFYQWGWSWGGRWTYKKDYMHFSANGR
jgi:hypothetical protein